MKSENMKMEENSIGENMANLKLIVIEKDENIYKTINLTAMLNTELSWKAKGIHYYLRTRPKNWKVHFNDLLNKSTDGHDSLKSGLKELKEKKFLYKTQIRDENTKRIIEWIYVSLPEPLDLDKDQLNTLIRETHMKGNPISGKPYPIVYNNISKKNKEKDYLKKDLNNLNRIENNPIGEKLKKTRLNFSPMSENLKIRKSHYLEYWNTLFYITHHKIQNSKGELSKTYDKAHKYCLQLRKGEFQNKSFNKDFLIKHKIPDFLINKKFTIEEIKKGMDLLSLLFKEGHWGNNKIKNKGLSSLLYNSKTQSSMFLAVINNPSMATDLVFKFKELKDPNPNITKKFYPILKDYQIDFEKDWDNKEKLDFYNNIKNLIKFHKNNPWICRYSTSVFFSDFIEFLEEENIKKFTPYVLSLDGWVWKNFIKFKKGDD